ncbi:unnamed protein product [Mesocestoides corti]|uniref:Recep_L_domain domain-containing protein n=1 Tax=Mesocestoides corti TaxID=53468 RepID=A0A0R3UCR8_MESCO|nr:unnamed protein product [Mesocestoides corti]
MSVPDCVGASHSPEVRAHFKLTLLSWLFHNHCHRNSACGLCETIRTNHKVDVFVDAFAFQRPTLILNVDGLIGVTMVDLLRHCGCFTRQEADEFIQIGTLNGLFVLARSIGFIGHFLDQRRLRQGLYRHPWEDITYRLPDPTELEAPTTSNDRK